MTCRRHDWRRRRRSFAFAVGALIPVVPYLLGLDALWLVTVVALVGLFLSGAAVTQVTSRPWWYGGIRQLVLRVRGRRPDVCFRQPGRSRARLTSSVEQSPPYRAGPAQSLAPAARTDDGSAHAPRQGDARGLYDPRFEHDACGVAFVATLTGIAGHDIVDLGLAALRNLEHRGASGAEPESGDGAGLLVQVPDAFLREVAGFELPPAGGFAVGLAFLPDDDQAERATMARIDELAAEERLTVLGWRDVPTAPALLGATARSAVPRFRQLFVAADRAPDDGADGPTWLALDRRAFCLRKRAEQETPVYFPSLSSRTLVYKGMLTTGQLEPFFPDLSDRRFASAIAVVHSRFSTNTFPSWPLAHPYRFIAHNGEINTVMGNRNWMRARESQLATDLIPGDLSRLFPICTAGASDSASFDEVLELLHLCGRSLAHAMLMMIPEAWENHTEMDRRRRAFYEFHSTVMEPWDGPACVVFTDGTRVGALLDRNGLRPGRFWVTDDGLVVLASEAGVLDLDPASVVRKGRLQPGRMFLVDLDEHRIVEDDEIKSTLAAAAPYDEWLHAGLIRLDDLPEREHVVHTHASVTRRQQTFGYTEESCACSWPRWRARERSRSAPWAPTRRSRPSPTGRG